MLFKKYTGITKSKLPPSRGTYNLIANSFTQVGLAKEKKKEQIQGLNRMDFQTFVLAMADIAN